MVWSHGALVPNYFAGSNGRWNDRISLESKAVMVEDFLGCHLGLRGKRTQDACCYLESVKESQDKLDKNHKKLKLHGSIAGVFLF